MLRKEGMDVELEAGPYGSFEVKVDDQKVVEGGALAFLGILPSLDEIRTHVNEAKEATPDREGGD